MFNLFSRLCAWKYTWVFIFLLLYNLVQEVSPDKLHDFTDYYIIWQYFGFRILFVSIRYLGSSLCWPGDAVRALNPAHDTGNGYCGYGYAKLKAHFPCSTLFPLTHDVLQLIGFYGFTPYISMSFLSNE